MVDQEARLKALAERSSYVENVLRQALIAELSSVAWNRNPAETLKVFNAEVDDAGFDVVLGFRSQMRYVQLKQAHDGKVPARCSIRLSFSTMPGSCVILVSHTIDSLRLTNFRFYGDAPDRPMPPIESLKATKAPGRRDAQGKRKIRTHYRDVPVTRFRGPLSAEDLLDALFPGVIAPVAIPEDDNQPGLVVPVPTAPMGVATRAWTLRDDNHGHFHGLVDLAESPLYLELSFRPNSTGPVTRVGLFKLDLRGLLLKGYVRYEPDGATGSKLRLRIKHSKNGKFFIQTRDGEPRQRIPAAKV